MRWVMVGVGAVLALMGTVWMLQGMNLLLGSPMTGQPFWIGAGLVAVAIGLGLLITGLRKTAMWPGKRTQP